MADQTATPSSGKSTGEKIGYTLMATAIPLGLADAAWFNTGLWFLSVPVAFVGSVVAIKANSRRLGKTRSFIMTWLGPLIGSLCLLIPLGLLLSPAKPQPPPEANPSPPPAVAAPKTEGVVPAPVPEDPPAAAEPAKPPEPKFTVTPSQLVREYKANPHVAEGKYGGESVRVRGTVEDFTGFSKDAITFTGSGWDLTAEFADDSLLRIRKGMRVVLACGEVYFGSDIRLYKCIAEQPPSPKAEGAASPPTTEDWALRRWQCDGSGTGINYSFELRPQGSKVPYSMRTPAGAHQGEMKISRLKRGSRKNELTDSYGKKTGQVVETFYVDVTTTWDELQGFRLVKDDSGANMYMMVDGRLLGSNSIAHCQ